jgi:hypothetical protein
MAATFVASFTHFLIHPKSIKSIRGIMTGVIKQVNLFRGLYTNMFVLFSGDLNGRRKTNKLKFSNTSPAANDDSFAKV